MLLESQIGANEQILWSGTKDKKVSVLEAIFNPMMPFALIWGIIDASFIGTMLKGVRYASAESAASPIGFVIPFFLLHLMPVWLYVGGIITAARKAQNTRYCITDQAVYIQQGILNTQTERFDYPRILSFTVGQSVFDKASNTGDVCLTLDQVVYSGKNRRAHQRVVKIENIPDYEDVFRMVSQYHSYAAANAVSRMPQNMMPSPVSGRNVFPPPQYGSQPQMPQNFNQPQTVQPQMPQNFNQPQTPPVILPPEPLMPSFEDTLAPDEFHDPTLSAFDFQNKDPFNDNNNGF